MNWSDIVPSDVAKKQSAWERRAKVLRMRELGFTLDAIARRLGVTRERVRQMESAAKRTRAMSPVEQYSRDFREVVPLADAIVKRAKARGKLAGPQLTQVDGSDGIPVLRVSSYGGKRVDDMTRDELIQALNAVWRSYVAVNARGVGSDRTALPDRSVGAYDDVLKKWFYSDAGAA